MTKIEPIGIGGLHRGLSIPEIYIENTKLHNEVNGLRKQRRKAREKNKQLQSNWNSLRELIEQYLENEKYSYMSDNPKDRCRYDIFMEIKDKMNELEGKDKE